MTVPLPSQIKSFVKPVSAESQLIKTDSAASSSKKMVYGKRPAHLTDRPLKDNEGLKALRDSLSEGPKGRVAPAQKKRTNRRAQRP